MSEIVIKENRLDDAQTVLDQLPEFDHPVPDSEFTTRLAGRAHLILTAYWNETPVACKIGYDRYQDGSFYSWLGGVLPDFRHQGLARRLMKTQEDWARKMGFKTIRLKTRPRYAAMLELAHQAGYKEIHRDIRVPDTETRILLEKTL